MNKNLNEVKNPPEFFTTFDLNISAVLVALGVSLNHIERQENGKVLFCFRSSPVVQKIIQNFWTQQLKVSPQKLFDSQKFLKNRLFSNF